jgi:hypothetical protein
MLPFSVVLLQKIHFYAIGLAFLWKCNKLIVTQQELLRYYGISIWCVGHSIKENQICNNTLRCVQYISYNAKDSHYIHSNNALHTFHNIQYIKLYTFRKLHYVYCIQYMNFITSITYFSYITYVRNICKSHALYYIH